MRQLHRGVSGASSQYRTMATAFNKRTWTPCLCLLDHFYLLPYLLPVLFHGHRHRRRRRLWAAFVAVSIDVAPFLCTMLIDAHGRWSMCFERVLENHSFVSSCCCSSNGLCSVWLLPFSTILWVWFWGLFESTSVW